MKELDEERARKKMLPSISGELNFASLDAMLQAVRTVAAEEQAAMSETDQQEILSYVKRYLAPADLQHGRLMPKTAMLAFALGILIEEHLDTYTALPDLRDRLWADMKKDGLTYAVYKATQQALRRA